MAGKRDGGLKDALGLDEAADALVSGGAAGSENGAGGQMMLFAERSVFGTVRTPEGAKLRPSGPGRPRGSLNRTTRDLVKLIESTGRHPLLAMAEIVATPIDVIAATLGCKKIEAAEYHRKVMSDLAPYVAQRLPLAVQVQGADAGMLAIVLGGGAGEGALAMTLAAKQGSAEAMATIEHEENQGLGGDAGGASHDDASHDEGK